MATMTACNGDGAASSTKSVTVAAMTKTVTKTVTEAAAANAPDNAADKSTAEAPGGSQTKATAIGATITVPSDDGADGASATMRIVSAKWQTKFSADDYSKPDNGALLLLDIEYTGKSGNTAINPMFDLSAKDAAGHTYNTTPVMAAGVSAINSQSLAVGEKARGVVAFDVPKKPITVTLTVGLDTVAARWSVHG